MRKTQYAVLAAMSASVLVLAGCSEAGTDAPSTSTEAAATSEVHWGYEGDGAPEHWGELSAEFEACGNGKEQSPINLSDATPEDLADIEFAYAASTGEVLNNGHTLQYTPSTMQKVTLDGEDLELAQLHMHTPAEHEVDGKQLPGEIHFVHKNAAGDITVLGILLEEGAPNELVQYLLDNAPENVDTSHISQEEINIADALPASHEYITYGGSLTTPPCSENVRWIVMTQPVTASAEQLQAFESLIGKNARPVQDQNGRELTLDATS